MFLNVRIPQRRLDQRLHSLPLRRGVNDAWVVPKGPKGQSISLIFANRLYEPTTVEKSASGTIS